jgi:hypothetical protein
MTNRTAPSTIFVNDKPRAVVATRSYGPRSETHTYVLENGSEVTNRCTGGRWILSGPYVAGERVVDVVLHPPRMFQPTRDSLIESLKAAADHAYGDWVELDDAPEFDAQLEDIERAIESYDVRRESLQA